jgi:hypothetical protein
LTVSKIIEIKSNFHLQKITTITYERCGISGEAAASTGIASAASDATAAARGQTAPKNNFDKF